MILKSNSSGPPLAIQSLSVAYRTEPVLWDVTWCAREGCMTAIVGPNGAGKTTMLNAAIDLVPALAGEARFWGRPFSEVRERVAYVPQRESVDWDFPVTALEVVEMGATRRLGWLLPSWTGRFGGNARLSGRTAALAALERVGMTEFANRPIGQLSGGQQQRVFLARALAQDADLFLLDEPFAGVDVTTEAVIADELRRLCDAGKTVIAVNHDVASVAERFDDIVLLSRTLIASGPVGTTLTPDNLARAYAGQSVLARV